MADKKQNWPRALADAMNLATSVAAAIAVGYFGGKWLDGKFDTGPWLSIGGLLFGMLTAGKMMWERLMIESRQKPSPGSAEDQD
ncbi:MAG TPA: AtpZ/AtpI family protein [Syntrophomonas sp.]|jgi:F0F1-type ATP synthase assembly protein I|nr:AtpZ/AtpI family protein [Syntrophomonas sp.]HRW11655.1 AtpZ/AtpI family protein [Syntrophomonas sp.]